ncbi:carboxypeptidase regulatory-like domain-containing protein [Hydrogenivirga sp.]
MKTSTAVLLMTAFALTGTSLSAEGKGHYNFRYVKYFSSSPAFAGSSGAGTIRGKVVYVGKRKLKNRKKLITKDKEVCGRGYKIDKVYVVSKDGGVKNAVVFIPGLGKPKAKKVTLSQERCEFHPRVLSMDAGGTLEVVNKDSVKHEANGVQDYETIFQLSQPKKGMVDRVKLEKPGVVEVTCNIHGWMKAWVVVVNSPYHAVTNDEGGFVLHGVPAGSYTLRLWHEGFGEKKLKVRVEEGKVTSVTFEVR